MPTKRVFWHTYILLCHDNTYYIGATNDLEARVERHNSGTGARYTRGRRPVRLVYSEAFRTKRQAMRREAELKKWSRSRKTALISASKNPAGDQ